MITHRVSTFVRRWHVRIGLSAAIVLVMLATTGILINHSQSLSLSETRIPPLLARLSYGLEERETQSIEIGELRAKTDGAELWVSADRDILTSTCSGNLIGARRFAEEIWVACEQNLSIYLVEDGAPLLVEQLNSYSGLPVPINRFGACDLAPCLISQSQQFRYSQLQLSWQASGEDNLSTFWSADPETEKELIVPAELNWNRWLLDLHSGRLFGNVGVFIVDLTGIALLILVTTGIIRWLRIREKSDRSQKK